MVFSNRPHEADDFVKTGLQFEAEERDLKGGCAKL